MDTPTDVVAPVSIVKGTVVYVNPEKFTVDVLLDKGMRRIDGIPIAGMYMNKLHGAGVYHMPELNSQCFVFMLPEGTRFVMGFLINETPEKDDENAVSAEDFLPAYRGLKEPLEPGDIYLGTVDGNNVIIRRGGIVQIGSTGLSQRVYIPVENMIRDYFQRYQAISPVGEIEWGHATLVSGEQIGTDTPAGSLEYSDYFIDGEKANKLDFLQSTPVLVKYNIKDLCQEDVSKGKFSVELRMGRLTTETLDPEEDIEHVFAHPPAGVELAESPVRESLASTPDQEGMGIRAEEKGIVSCTIYCHDEGANKDKVTYSFQLNRDGDNFIFTRGHVHVEVVESVYANLRKGAKIDFGDANVLGKPSVVELLQSNELRTSLKALIHEVVNDMEVDATNIKLNATGDVILGEGADDFAVRLNALEAFMKTGFSCTTAFGPSGPMTTNFVPGVGSTTVKVKE